MYKRRSNFAAKDGKRGAKRGKLTTATSNGQPRCASTLRQSSNQMKFISVACAVGRAKVQMWSANVTAKARARFAWSFLGCPPPPPGYYNTATVAGSRKNLCGVMRRLEKISTHPRRFFVFCEDFRTKFDISRPAPESSLALIFYAKRKKSIDFPLSAIYNIRMTNYQKSQLRDHFKKWNVVYTMVAFLTFCMIVIGWEARQEQRKELEQYYEPTQEFEDIA